MSSKQIIIYAGGKIYWVDAKIIVEFKQSNLKVLL
jgi:hypothetical protein